MRAAVAERRRGCLPSGGLEPRRQTWPELSHVTLFVWTLLPPLQRPDAVPRLGPTGGVGGTAAAAALRARARARAGRRRRRVQTLTAGRARHAARRRRARRPRPSATPRGPRRRLHPRVCPSLCMSVRCCSVCQAVRYPGCACCGRAALAGERAARAAAEKRAEEAAGRAADAERRLVAAEAVQRDVAARLARAEAEARAAQQQHVPGARRRAPSSRRLRHGCHDLLHLSNVRMDEAMLHTQARVHSTMAVSHERHDGPLEEGAG